uniref:Uncharacterized protein n=1 Tax=Zea mays TaxID=4577 RepID=A0A804R3T5_MAIZE
MAFYPIPSPFLSRRFPEREKGCPSARNLAAPPRAHDCVLLGEIKGARVCRRGSLSTSVVCGGRKSTRLLGISRRRSFPSRRRGQPCAHRLLWLEEIQVTEAILAFGLLQQRCEDEVLEVAY